MAAADEQPRPEQLANCGQNGPLLVRRDPVFVPTLLRDFRFVKLLHEFSGITLTGPKAGRRIGLMADAFGTYFLTHSRGEVLNAKRMLGSEKSYYQGGAAGPREAGRIEPIAV
ncbi:hypothetical protein ACFWJ4_36470 [Kitasatospora sp. NPDC127067]|uniref:hypothetical protein n=1 Tax=Kitasatospora sp. NPDC127067 TaxID=3347126 RepID=UPI00364D2ABA